MNDGVVDVYSTQCRFRFVDSFLILTPQVARNLSSPRENGKITPPLCCHFLSQISLSFDRTRPGLAC
eukprot:scaffold1119_cov108-Skeletonema_dohrnii-CCMP3373.AAC.6